MKFFLLSLFFFIMLASTPVKANFITFSQCIDANHTMHDDKYSDKFKKNINVKWSQDLWDRQNYKFIFRQDIFNYKNKDTYWYYQVLLNQWEKKLINEGYEKVKWFEKRSFSINLKSNVITMLELYTDEYVQIFNNNRASFNEAQTEGDIKFSPMEKVYSKKFKITSYADGIITATEIRTNSTATRLVKIIIYLDRNTIHYKYEGAVYTPYYVCNSGNTSGGGSGDSSGTAFFINNKGNLVTNHHVIDQCKQLKISYFDKEYETKVLHSDKNLDLAVLKSEVRPKDYISVSKNPPKKLQNIFAAGYPLGKGLSDDLKITSGIISSIKGFKDNVNEIQIDAAINKGNSGGPIVSEDGYLVGISVAGLDKSKTESVNFGIKASSLEQFLNVNEIKYNKPIYEFSTSKDKLRNLLEQSTVYISCGG